MRSTSSFTARLLEVAGECRDDARSVAIRRSAPRRDRPAASPHGGPAACGARGRKAPPARSSPWRPPDCWATTAAGALAGRLRGGIAALLFARPRRSAIHGRRRPATGAADRSQSVRRRNCDFGRRRAADPGVRGPGRSRHRSRPGDPGRTGPAARARLGRRRHGGRTDARSRRRGPLRRGHAIRLAFAACRP